MIFTHVKNHLRMRIVIHNYIIGIKNCSYNRDARSINHTFYQKLKKQLLITYIGRRRVRKKNGRITIIKIVSLVRHIKNNIN